MMMEVFRSDVAFGQPNPTGLIFRPVHPDHLRDQTIVWFDLHVSGAGFKNCDPYEREAWLPFEKGKNGSPKFIRINPGKTLIVQTAEILGTNEYLTGVIVGSAGRSLKGLLVTPGKIDPNFGPQPVVLALANASEEPIWVAEGDKLAVVAFARLDTAHITERVKGHAQSVSDRLPPWLQRVIATVRDLFRRYKKVGIATIAFYLFVIFTQAYVRLFFENLIVAVRTVRGAMH